MGRKVRVGVYGVIAAAALCSAIGSSPAAEVAGGAIPKSPAFSAQQLLALPASSWITNGGNIFNMKVTDRNPLYFEFVVDVEVRDVAHLQNILGALRVSSAVE